jgi:hypothetical protein
MADKKSEDAGHTKGSQQTSRNPCLMVTLHMNQDGLERLTRFIK